MNGKVLIADDVATNRIALKARLGAAAFVPILACTGEECLRLASSERPDLIILDSDLSDLTTDQVISRLKYRPETRDIPILVLASTLCDTKRKLMFEAGADEVFPKSTDDQLLQSRLRNLLRRRQEWSDLAHNAEQGLIGLAEADAEFSHPGTIAIVTDFIDVGVKLRRALSGELRDECVVLTSCEALQDTGPLTTGADVFVIVGLLSRSDGYLRLLSALRSRPTSRHSGVILICEDPSPLNPGIGFDMGADAVVSHAITSTELALRIRQQMRAKRRTDQRRERIQTGLRLAVIDSLTGLYNRRYAMARIATMIEQAQGQSAPLAVMVADLDRFKAVNDQYGHRAGNVVLTEVARRFLDSLRAEDLLARIGGEEFLIAIAGLQADSAMKVGKRLCDQIQSVPFEVQPGVFLNVTLSVGVHIYDPPRAPTHGAYPGKTTESLSEHLIECADHALMQSKMTGRNRVSLTQSAA